MRKLFIIMASVVALGLSACGLQQQSTKSQIARAGRISNAVTPGQVQAQTSGAPLPSTGITSYGWGVLSPSSSSAVLQFLSTDFNPGEVGNTVGCSTGAGLTGSAQPCAVEFAMTATLTGSILPLSLTTGRLSAYNGSPTGFSPGFITMVIWDSLTGQVDASGDVLPPIPVVIPLDTNQSYIYGSQAQLIFDDGSGTLAFVGNLNSSTMSGSVTFQNQVIQPGWGAAPQSGQLGSFQIATCAAIGC